METAANRMAPPEFAFAVEKRPAPALRKPATSDPSPPRQINVVRTSPRSPQRSCSRLQSRVKSQLSLGSIILLTQTRRARATSPHFKRSRIDDIPCTLMMLTRLAVGLEPLNALDAAHRSPRSV